MRARRPAARRDQPDRAGERCPWRVADRLRADGIEIVPDEREFIRRRRSKTAAEIAGVRRAQAAADAGMAAAAELLRDAADRGGVLHARR